MSPKFKDSLSPGEPNLQDIKQASLVTPALVVNLSGEHCVHYPSWRTLVLRSSYAPADTEQSIQTRRRRPTHNGLHSLCSPNTGYFLSRYITVLEKQFPNLVPNDPRVKHYLVNVYPNTAAFLAFRGPSRAIENPNLRIVLFIKHFKKVMRTNYGYQLMQLKNNNVR